MIGRFQSSSAREITTTRHLHMQLIFVGQLTRTHSCIMEYKRGYASEVVMLLRLSSNCSWSTSSVKLLVGCWTRVLVV